MTVYIAGTLQGETGAAIPVDMVARVERLLHVWYGDEPNNRERARVVVGALLDGAEVRNEWGARLPTDGAEPAMFGTYSGAERAISETGQGVMMRRWVITTPARPVDVEVT